MLSNLAPAMLALMWLPGQAAPTAPSRGIPLVAGTVWVYKGTGKGWDATNRRMVTDQLAWHMKVERVTTLGKLTVAVVEGHPDDVAWGIPEGGPSHSLLIQDGARWYRVQPEGPALVPASEAAARKLMHADDKVFEIPLKVGQEFGRGEGSRQKGFHCWVVRSIAPEAVQVKGVAPGTRANVYSLTYRTAPDHQIVDIAEGIGIVRFRYVHHGTPAECDLRLVEIRRPPK